MASGIVKNLDLLRSAPSDLNDVSEYKTPIFQWIAGRVPNSPYAKNLTNNYFSLVVTIGTADGYATQINIPVGDNGFFIRNQISNNWNDWKKINPS